MHGSDPTEEAERQREHFLGMLGHELRNPLAAIRSAAELLRVLAPDDVEIQTVQGVLERQTAQMAKLVDGLLDVSRIAHGKLHLEETTVDLVQVLGDVIADRATTVEDRGLALRADLPSEPLPVRGDPTRLAQVFDNLLVNAATFTDPPGMVTIEAGAEGDAAVVRVTDTGVGFGEELRKRMFEPFTQGPQDEARLRGGIGMGLALVRGIVTLHGGSVDAYSEGPGRGACITVRLPLDVGAPHDVQPPGPAPKVPRQRILIVEDNEDAAAVLSSVLSKVGHDVSIAATGEEALRRMRSLKPTVVLCDLGLPGKSGYDVARAVRSDPRLADTILVALTGYGRAEDRRRSEEAGFDAHVTKPASVEDLHTVLSRLVRTRSE